MPADPAVVRFKFRYVRRGETGGIRSRKGLATSKAVKLDDVVVPYEAIGETVSRDNRLLLQVADPAALPRKATEQLVEGMLILEIYRATADSVERFVDRHCAALRMAAKRSAAREQGLEHLIRSAECPTCGSEVDLSDLPESPYVYCPFCDTVFDAAEKSSAGRSYRTCDECGFFGRVQSYPEFFFYFLLIVYGFSYKKRFLCDQCAHRLFVRAALLNALFVLGLPTAIWVKIKSMRGREAGMAALAAGNRAAGRGDLVEAARCYDSVRESFPEHPGVLMNEGLAHLNGGSRTKGTELLDRALKACPNYHPLIRLLNPPQETHAAAHAR